MKRLCVLLLIVMTAGCAHVPKNNSGTRLSELQLSLAQKQEMLDQLEALVSQQQAQLKEKDAQIESLKERLKQFGIF